MKSETIWNMLAGRFDGLEKKTQAQIHSETVEKTKKWLDADDVVLDFGCATGTMAGNFTSNVKMIYGIDTSPKMIEVAKRNASKRKIENMDFACATIFDERYMMGSFDVIMAFGILHLLDNHSEVVQRINELLKPGGLMISLTPCFGDIEEWMTYVPTLFSLLNKTGILPPFRFIKLSELSSLLAEEKFRIIETDNFQDHPHSYLIVAKKIE